MTPTIRVALEQARQRFAALPDVEPRLDAEVLMSHVLGRERSYLLTWPERELTPQQHDRFQALVQRRAAGEPVAHLTGQREFWSLPLRVTPDTLIPRPETELLVEHALAHMPSEAGAYAADLGTGTGAVALALASERPSWRLRATDLSDDALTVARANAAALRIDTVEFARGDWCEALDGLRFTVIVSNPPYVAEDDPHLNRGDVRFDPASALRSGADGLDDIRRIAHCCRRHLERDGWLLLEHGPGQGAACRQVLLDLGYQDVGTHRDLAGRDRITEARWHGERVDDGPCETQA